MTLTEEQIALVKKLWKETGCGLMECKITLKECNWDLGEARKKLRDNSSMNRYKW